MIASPYHTQVTTHYDIGKLDREIKRAQALRRLDPLTTPGGNRIKNASVIVPADDYDVIPNFTQPVNIGTATEPHWVVDGRPFMRFDRQSGTYKLMAENDWSFQCTRVALMMALDGLDGVIAMRLGKVPAKAFVRWVVLSLAQRFNLDMETQMRLSVFVAYYYYQLFMDNEGDELEFENLTAMANTISGATAVPSHTVIDIITPVGSLHTMARLITAIQEHSGNLRLKGLNYTGLYMVLSTSWIGVHSRENVGVALEHPATLLTLLYSAAGEKSFRKTIIAKRMETSGRIAELDQFVKQVYRLVESQFV